MSEKEINEVFENAFRLPSEERARLAHALLRSIEPAAPKRRASDLFGILKTAGPSPTDAEVEKMIDDHRMEKYGR